MNQTTWPITLQELLFLLLSTFAAQAQTVHTGNIYFESGSHQLTPSALQTLDSLGSLLLNIPQAYRIEIQAHTDAIGGEAFNQRLSERRAQAVGQYYRNKAFTNLVLKSWGRQTPIADNASKAGQALNRRAEIAIVVDVPTPKALGNTRLVPSRYTIDATTGGTIKHPSGTQLRIPAHAFVDAQGQPVEGAVVMEYLEYRDPIDFILSDLPMSNINGVAGDHFHSAGMFSLNAYQNEQALALKADRTILVDLVPVAPLEDMEWYQLDEEQQQWVSSGPVERLLEGNPAPAGVRRSEWYLCSQSLERAVYKLAETGPTLLNQTASFVQTIALGDSLYWRNRWAVRDSLKRLKEGIRAFESTAQEASKQSNLLSLDYHPKLIGKNRQKINFILNNTQRSNRNTSPAAQHPFEGVRWRCAAQGVDLGIFNKAWTDIQLHPTAQDQYFQLTLRGYSSKGSPVEVTLQKVEIKPQRSMGRAARLAFPQKILTRYTDNQQQQQALWDKINGCARQADSLRTILEPFQQEVKRGDSLYQLQQEYHCFHKDNKPYMSAPELLMPWKAWYAYVDGNRAVLKTRYAQLKRSPLYQQTKAAIARTRDMERRRDSVAQARIQLNAAQDQRIQSMGNTIGLSSLGVYNPDQIKRLSQPEELELEYQDAQGQELAIVSAYLINKKLNGAIKYNGTYGFSPYKLVYSRNSPNTLVAFDASGNGYLVTAKQFRQLSKKKEGRHTVVVKKIGPTQSKKELLASL